MRQAVTALKAAKTMPPAKLRRAREEAGEQSPRVWGDRPLIAHRAPQQKLGRQGQGRLA